MNKAALCALLAIGLGVAIWVARKPQSVPVAPVPAVAATESADPDTIPTAESLPTNESIPLLTDRTEPVVTPKYSLADELRACLAEPSTEVRHRKYAQLLQAMKARDAREFMNVLEEFQKRGMDLSFERQAFWRRRGELDPEQALADWEQLFHATRNGAERDPRGLVALNDALTQLFRGWGGANPDGARAWLAAHADYPEFRTALFGFLDGYTTKDSAGATDFVFQSFKGDEAMLLTAMKRVCGDIMRDASASQAAAWFEKLPTDDMGVKVRQGLVRDITDRLVDEDLSVAMVWTTEQAGQPWRDYSSINVVVDHYAAQDPAAAMEWINSLPRDPNNGTITGVGAVVRHWFTQDPGAFEQWLNSMRPSKSRLFAQAAGDYAYVLAPTDYNKAVQWLNEIPSDYPASRRYFENAIAPYAPAATR